MRIFEHFTQRGDPCPVCGTMDDKPTVLVPIQGTERGNIVQARQVHVVCFNESGASRESD